MNEPFPYAPALQFGWNTMKRHFWLFFIVMVLVGVLEVVPNGAGTAIRKEYPGWAALLKIGYSVVRIIFSIGVIHICLKILDTGLAEVGDLFARLDLFLRFLGGALLYALIVIAGLILLIVPGIIWAIKYKYFGYFIVDKNLGPVDALDKSGQITYGYKLDLFLFGLLLAVINLGGLLCLGVGLFATVPTTWMARAFVYRHLLTQSELVVEADKSSGSPVGQQIS
jgi:uncharacterized membrane protein